MALRPELDGLKVRMPGEDTVYLIDGGKKRGIPSPEVYNALFTTWKNIHLDLDVALIDTGDIIPETACLFRCSDSAMVFFLDGVPPNQIKRHVANPAVMARYEFKWPDPPWNCPLSAVGFTDGTQITKTGRPD